MASLAFRQKLIEFDDGGASDEHLRESSRLVERVWRDYEETRLRCREQLELIAAQREFLRGLTSPSASVNGVNGAPAAAGAGGVPEEENRAGE